MSSTNQCAAILLAAGAATRFGGDKLAAVVDGDTVLNRSAKALAASGCTLRAAVVSEKTQAHAPFLRQLGYEILVNSHATDGLSTSVREGVSWAARENATSVLIALADMPFVPASHFCALLQRSQKSDASGAYTRCGARRTPPAVFDSHLFAALRALHGDFGARAILKDLPEAWGVEAPEAALRDIDTPQDARDLAK